MKSFRKIHDLTPNKHATPLVVSRAPRTHRNLLRIEQTKIIRRAEFDLVEKNPSLNPERAGIFVPQKKGSRWNRTRVKIATSALGLVLLLNFVGVFNNGKATLERAVSSAVSGVATLTEASKSFAAGNFDTSTDQFSTAVSTFQSAEKDLLVLGGAGAVLATKPDNIQAGSALVTAGKLLADAGQNFSNGVATLTNALTTYSTRQKEVTLGKTDVPSFAQEIQTSAIKITTGLTLLDTAEDVLAKIEIASLPEALQTNVRTARASIGLITTLTTPYRDALPLLPNLIGENGPKKYLVLFQNPDEIRPTGGFIGSFAEITLLHGFVMKFRIRDVYEIDSQLVGRFPPPEGFGFITNSWGLRDSNYHPDFPISATATAYLYEEAGGSSVDGVFAVTSDLLTELVKLTGGEIKLTRFQQPITADDLNLLLSLIVETKTDGAENPKQILTEVWETLREKLTIVPHAQIFSELVTAIQNKEIQFWAMDPDMKRFPAALQIDGALKPTNGDYLFVVNTSLSGNKSDRYATNQLTHVTNLDANGIATDTLTITRTHGWDDVAEEKINTLAQTYGIKIPESLRDVLGRGRNVDLVKVFVPSGAKLITATGIDLDRIETHASGGKTYFLLSLTTPAGDSRQVTLTYTLPQKFEKNYQLLVEKQAGENSVALEKKVNMNGKEIFSQELKLERNQEISISF